MNLTINLNSLIDDIYADSALTALLRRHDPKFADTVISPDLRRALIRQLNAAAAYVVASLSSRIDSVTFPRETDDDPVIQITAEPQSDANPDTVADLFSSAVVFATLNQLAVQAGDYSRADRYNDRIRCFTDAITDALGSIRHCPILTTHYL